MSERTGTDGADRGTRCEAIPQPSCSQCGTLGAYRYRDLRDRHFSAPGVWAHLECPGCGLVWLDPRPTPSAIGQLYSDYYTHDSMRDDTSGTTRQDPGWMRAIMRGIPGASQGYGDALLDWWERDLGKLLSFFGPLAELAKRGTMWLPAEKRGALLDVGCGDGSFMRHMRGLGWQVSGIEQDALASETALARLGTDCVYREIGDASAARPDGFDVVTLSHVIEHLLDPIDTLVACLDCLKPGGCLVIATPNFKSRAHRHFGRHWLHLDPPRHIQLYDPDTLDTLVQRAGFEVESVDTPSSSSHFVWQASALIEERGTLPGIRIEDRSIWIAIESGLFWMWEYLLTRFGQQCGEEVMLVATKPVTLTPPAGGSTPNGLLP